MSADDEMPPELALIVSVSKDQFCPATYNNPELAKRLIAVWKKPLGNDDVKIVDPTMGEDDFSEYGLPDNSIPAEYNHFVPLKSATIAEYKENGKAFPTL